MTLRWGMVGTGRVARTALAPAIVHDSGSSLVGVYSPNPDRARAFAEEFGAPNVHSSLASLLGDPMIDAVAIASPNRWHAEQVRAAAEAGKHVLCEKPLARNSAEARDALEAAAAHGVMLGVDFQTRYYPAFKLARSLVSNGELGSVEIVELSAGPGGRAATWQYDTAVTGLAVLHHVGIHLVDAARFLLGEEPAGVTAVWRVDDAGADMTVLGLLEFPSGAIGYLNATEALRFPLQDLRIFGSRGRLLASNATRSWLDGQVEIKVEDEGGRIVETANFDAYKDLVTEFRLALDGGRAASPSGEDALRAEVIIEALAESARSGRRVSLG